MAYRLDEEERRACLEPAIEKGNAGAVVGVAVCFLYWWLVLKGFPGFPGIIGMPVIFGAIGFIISFSNEFARAEKVIRDERLRRAVVDRGTGR